ncbi:MAG TPA: PLP-dependent aminotransferase family protein [Bryobacteraceae bacterium]|nr:PLP-dependent aminotransferase family protein [Bryobacteraceae bacterium]
MVPRIELDHSSETPLYRQLYEQLRSAILANRMVRGERLPATRELAWSLGLNRQTVGSAYDLLEAEKLIKAYVGRGSFVEGAETARLDWESLIPADDNSPAPASASAAISFSASRPPEDAFPLEAFRETCREVIDSSEAVNILQLGPASGYGPLRRYLLDESRERGFAREDDDILMTSGCQQGFDLIQRVLASHGETVILEDPVYPGLRNVFQRGGARVIGAPVGEEGVEVETLGRLIEKEHPRLMVLTPNFQNPTGTTIPEAARREIVELARRNGVVIVENDLYGALRYSGTDLPSFKRLDVSGDSIQLGSFSKIAFPGLRVGWAIGPRHFIARLTEAKEASDLHSDQLSQAVLLRFAESGRLADHHVKTLASGAERLKECLAGCARELPQGSRYTRPEGGMNVWVRLPEMLDASELAARAARKCQLSSGPLFCGDAPADARAAAEFCGLETRADSRRNARARIDFQEGVGAEAGVPGRTGAGGGLKKRQFKNEGPRSFHVSI